MVRKNKCMEVYTNRHTHTNYTRARIKHCHIPLSGQPGVLWCPQTVLDCSSTMISIITSRSPSLFITHFTFHYPLHTIWILWTSDPFFYFSFEIHLRYLLSTQLWKKRCAGMSSYIKLYVFTST